MRFHRFLGLTILAASLVVPANAQKWRFVVTGDGRWEGGQPRDKMDVNGVNVTINKEIASAAIKEKAKFILYTGDLVSGAKTDKEVESQLQTWLVAMKPAYDAGVKVYVCRGNHETYCENPALVWRKTFKGKYAMPQNGPKGEEDISYSLPYKNAMILSVDDYSVGKERVNQAWVDGVLKANKKPLVFVFSHEMAFRGGDHKDNLDADPAARDRFWNSLKSAGVRAYFCGHDHLYDHSAIGGPGRLPDPAIHQFIVGTAGAPFYHGDDHGGANSNWTVTPVKHIEQTFGYAVVDVNGSKVTITFKGRVSPGVYKPMDTWGYTASVPKARREGHASS